MNALRLASFGVRGFVGRSLNPRIAMDLASAFGTYLERGTVLVGRDTRYSSPMFHSAVVSSLMGSGCHVVDFGVCPTPILQHAVPLRGASGAISISGGHSDVGWNSLSLIDRRGAFLELAGGEMVLELYHSGDFERSDWKGIGSLGSAGTFVEPYLAAMTPLLSGEAIREKRYTVLMDPVGGAGCTYLEPFANHFGMKMVAINGDPTGYLAREPEPRPRSAKQMASVISHTGGDAGFVFSSDLQRMSMVTEGGEPVSEEYTLAVIANHVLGTESDVVVTNCCSTRMLDDVATTHGSDVVKTAVGQAYIGAAVADERAVLGGEGSGSVMLPAFSLAFDGLLMAALVVDAMAVRSATLSELIEELPRYHIVKRSLACESSRAYQALNVVEDWLRREVSEAINSCDGLRVDWPDGWVHVRQSRTEQLVRVISESNERSLAHERAETLMRLLEREI